MRLHALLTYAEEVGKEKVGGGGMGKDFKG